jgi:hypothetical protein
VLFPSARFGFHSSVRVSRESSSPRWYSCFLFGLEIWFCSLMWTHRTPLGAPSVASPPVQSLRQQSLGLDQHFPLRGCSSRSPEHFFPLSILLAVPVWTESILAGRPAASSCLSMGSRSSFDCHRCYRIFGRCRFPCDEFYARFIFYL